MITTPRVLTVSQLNFYIKSILDNDSNLQYVFLEGEISNLTDHYSSGHMYFSVKDEKSVVRAVMFSYAAKNLKFKPQNGMKVIIRGRVTIYEPSGQYQVYAEDMQPDGVGVLALQFEQLKQKLSKEGLFDKSHKKPIPMYPNTIGVITSPTGAAIRDIYNILSRRYPCAEIVIYPVLVQGECAAPQLTSAVNVFSESDIADVIIIGRGGGSQEDLWAFNDEALARAIYNCKTPIISAVGHETDFTISDFVADLRAPTPSAAAELAVPDKAELMQNIYANRQYVDSLIEQKLNALQRELDNNLRLMRAYSPEGRINDSKKALDSLSLRLDTAVKNILSDKTKSLAKTASKLEALNPVSVLARGFLYATDQNGNSVTSVKSVSVGDKITLNLKDGTINTIVTE